MGLGDSLKSWAKSKATELITADGSKADVASANAEAAEQDIKSDSAEALARTLIPQYDEMKKNAEARESAAAEKAEREHDEEIAALPVGSVQLSISGTFDGQFIGQLPSRFEELPAEKVANPEWESSDPYANRPTLVVELYPKDEERPSLGGHDLVRWRFEVPSYTGDGTYDLAAIAKAREAANHMTEYLEWEIAFADHDDCSFYFYPDAGPSTVKISEGGTHISVSMNMSGAMGDLAATAEITCS